MQRASAAFGFLIFVLWLAILAVGLAYVTVWAATRRRPQWRIFAWLAEKPAAPAAKKPGAAAAKPAAKGAEIISFERFAAERKRKSA
jgi:uncharacterized iron-regulated membrane protein